jgi:acetyl esterase
MPLDPKVRLFLDQLAAAGMPALSALGVEGARAAIDAMASTAGSVEDVAAVRDLRIPGPAGEIAIRIYTPTGGTAPRPALVYYHGGGWVIGSLASHDGICRALANAVPAIVVAVDYRLAPEHPFPAAAEDAHAAARWVAEHAAEIGADPRRIAVGGDSAGGNLAAVTALMARDRGGPALAFQLLVYPVTDTAMDTASYRENADGYFLTRADMTWFFDHYLPRAADRVHPYAAPLLAPDLRGLPPAAVITAEFDPLRDEGEAYATRLRAAGVAVTRTRYAGMIHGFFGLSAMFEQASAALEEAAAALRAALRP